MEVHNANMPMQYAAIVKGCKNDNCIFLNEKMTFFLIYAIKHRLLVHVIGGSNEYPP